MNKNNLHNLFYIEIAIIYFAVSLFILFMYEFANKLFGVSYNLYLIIFIGFTLAIIVNLIGYRRDIKTITNK